MADCRRTSNSESGVLTTSIRNCQPGCRVNLSMLANPVSQPGALGLENAGVTGFSVTPSTLPVSALMNRLMFLNSSSLDRLEILYLCVSEVVPIGIVCCEQLMIRELDWTISCFSSIMGCSIVRVTVWEVIQAIAESRITSMNGGSLRLKNWFIWMTRAVSALGRRRL